MSKLVFFDTETTGNTEKDFLCQLAYKQESETFSALYKPSIPIPPEASAIHHITNKMVADKEVFKESSDYAKIKKLFEDEDTVMVAHNAPFDLLVIKKEGIVPKKFICTLRVARHLDKEEVLTQYKLQYLRYALELEVEAKEIKAHDALGDVLVLEELYKRFKKELSVEEMIEISSHPSLLHTFKFGKYNGKRIEEVMKTDKGYCEWLLGEKLKSPELDEDWVYSLKHYLGK